MTKFTYQATSLTNFAKLLEASAESKNINDSNWSAIGVFEQERTSTDGSRLRQHVLYGETQQPTFLLGLTMVLSTDEVEDNHTTTNVLTRDLETALRTFGQHMVTVSLHDDGMVQMCMPATEDGEATKSKNLMVGGEPDSLLLITEMKQPQAQLADQLMLLDALRSAVPVASVRGNALKMQGVRITLDPEYLCVESANPGVIARTKFDNPWTQAPKSRREFVISIDAARRLVATLNQYGSTTPLLMDWDDTQLYLQTEAVYMEAVIG